MALCDKFRMQAESDTHAPAITDQLLRSTPSLRRRRDRQHIGSSRIDFIEDGLRVREKINMTVEINQVTPRWAWSVESSAMPRRTTSR